MPSVRFGSAPSVRDTVAAQKINYEIHGNTIAHLDLHMFPRYTGDPFVVLTGLGRDCIEMREVSPMGGLLPDEDRVRVLATG